MEQRFLWRLDKGICVYQFLGCAGPTQTMLMLHFTNLKMRSVLLLNLLVPCFDLYCNVINCSNTRLVGGEPKSEAVATTDISSKVNILEEVEPLKVEKCSALKLLARANSRSGIIQ